MRGALQAVGALVGVTRSGEEKQIDFTGQGTVLVQSSEAELMGCSNVQSLIAQISGLYQGDLQQLAMVINNRLSNR